MAINLRTVCGFWRKVLTLSTLSPSILFRFLFYERVVTQPKALAFGEGWERQRLQSGPPGVQLACVAGTRMGGKGPKGARKFWEGRRVPHALRALPRHALRALVFSLFPPLRHLPRRVGAAHPRRPIGS